MQTGVIETLDEKAFFVTINWVATLSLRTYGMTVNIDLESLLLRAQAKALTLAILCFGFGSLAGMTRQEVFERLLKKR